MGDEVSDVEVEIPALPEYVGVVRHVMGAMVRMSGRSPDLAEDVKLAVSEAVTNALAVAAGSDSRARVRVHGSVEGEQVHLEVARYGEEGEPSGPPAGDWDGESGGLSFPILEGLVDHLELVEQGDRPTVRMTLSEGQGL